MFPRTRTRPGLILVVGLVYLAVMTPRLRTAAVHAGEFPDPATGASAPNLVMSSTFVTRDAAGFSAHDLDD